MTAIHMETDTLKEWISSKEIEEKKKKALHLFDDAIQTQVIGTLDHLKIYQLFEWRKLAIGESGEDRTVTV
jgi:hypothetical protein